MQGKLDATLVCLDLKKMLKNNPPTRLVTLVPGPQTYA